LEDKQGRRKNMRTLLFVVLFTIALSAGNAHFVGVPQLDTVDNALFASGKIAGLGNVPQIHVVLSGDAACINPGGNHPKAANKESFSVGRDFPVQNGKALFQLALEATFQPECSPPMTVIWSNVLITVTAEDGTFISFP
jgi:hypothetical protein